MDVFRSARVLEALLVSTPIERSVIEPGYCQPYFGRSTNS